MEGGKKTRADKHRPKKNLKVENILILVAAAEIQSSSFLSPL